MACFCPAALLFSLPMLRFIYFLASVVCACIVFPCFAQEQQVLSGAEQKLEKMAVSFEDVAEALRAVQDVHDADLVASRVAVNFLMLRNLHQEMLAMQSNADVRPEYAKEFTQRCAEARKSAVASIVALQQQEYYGSVALPAATSLAALMKDPLPPDKAARAAWELKLNNMEMIVLLLDEVRDPETAATVTSLVEYALACGEILEMFAEEYASHPLDEESSMYYGRRVEDYHVDFGRLVEFLKEHNYYDSAELRQIFVQDEPQLPID